jgi:hypothetical protein
MLRQARHTMVEAAKASPFGPGLRTVARRLRGAARPSVSPVDEKE